MVNFFFFLLNFFFFNLNCLHRRKKERKKSETFPKTAYNIYLSFKTINKLLDQKFWLGRRFLLPHPKSLWRPPKKWKFHILLLYGVVTYQIKAPDFRIAKKWVPLKKSWRVDFRGQKGPKKAKFGPYLLFSL